MKRFLVILFALMIFVVGAFLVSCNDENVDDETLTPDSNDTNAESEGLAYTVNSDRKTCTITGLGECTDIMINIPKEIDGYSVTAIGNNAFSDATHLENVIIGDSITYIGDSAFSGCTRLTSITIPSSVTSIGGSAFRGCIGLESITLPFVGATKDGTNNTHFGYIFGASVYSSNGIYVPSGLKTVVITGSTSIGKYAFYHCRRLTSVTIPDSVKSIGNYAFLECIGLTRVKYLGNIAGWCAIVFDDYDSNPLYYAGKLYINDDLVTNLVIPDSVTSISDEAFYNYTGLTSVTIGDSVTNIGDSAFKGCTGLTSVTIGNSVTNIGWSAFSGCTGLTSVTIGNSVTNIGGYAFSGCTGLTSITLPDSARSVGNYAFRDCTGLTSVTIPCRVRFIQEGAFKDCTGLTSVTIPDSVTSIGHYAFRDCTGLTSIKYRGTQAQWNTISKGILWDYDGRDCDYTVTFNYTGE